MAGLKRPAPQARLAALVVPDLVHPFFAEVAKGLAEALRSFIERPVFDADAVDRSGFEAYSARESTRALAAALDLACARQS